MTIHAIRELGDPVLRERCRPVTDFDDALVALVADLLEACRLPGRAGLAAPQIGVARRVFSYNVEGVEGYVVNPRLVHLEDRQEGDEGCLSIPGIWASTPRALRAVVAGVDVEGNPVEVDGTELLARCLQHETDHLDGILYIDRLDRGARKKVMKEIRARNVASTG
jgi:peptide deformylase